MRAQRYAREQFGRRPFLVPRNVPPPGQKVVEDQPGSNGQPRARAVAVDGDEDLDSLDELWQVLEQPGTLAQRLAHQADVEVFEVADAAVDQLRRPG